MDAEEKKNRIANLKVELYDLIELRERSLLAIQQKSQELEALRNTKEE